ncbi:2-keto-4-pentenoate hydratase [Halomonas kalidii]|uniref:Fumarylacetoacetate hydrolase family protein n=1 Tax=Halomonas kalidii TaxID=3043293 RepID=A0ABT6VHI3_9GAMM|nr:fumarylacetoacetate hydrolase family protein [Halomonas kalidii]MDI5933444.1 fumarylacetoacetate hydrolase family protein [Halomonas kalidii]
MSLIESHIASASALLVEAHRRRRRVERLPDELAPSCVEDAYAIQDRVVAALSRSEVTAWKVGAPDAHTTPIAAPILAQDVMASPATVPADRLHMRGVEVELCYRIRADLPLRESPYTVAEVAAAIDDVRVAIEVVDTRLQEWETCGELWKLADNQINAGLVLGTGTRPWRDLDPTRLAGQLFVNGGLQAEGVGRHAVGDPFLLLPWWVNHLVARGRGVRRGDVVTTGTWTGMAFVEPGSEVVARFPGLGEARVTFPV